MLKKMTESKKPENTGVFGLLSFVLTRMSNVLMFTTSAVPIVTTMSLPGRLVIPVALVDAVPGVAVLQPLVLFAPEPVGLSSIVLPLSTGLSQQPLKYGTKKLNGRAE